NVFTGQNFRKIFAERDQSPLVKVVIRRGCAHIRPFIIGQIGSKHPHHRSDIDDTSTPSFVDEGSHFSEDIDVSGSIDLHGLFYLIDTSVITFHWPGHSVVDKYVQTTKVRSE